jgi:hypothetical protein
LESDIHPNPFSFAKEKLKMKRRITTQEYQLALSIFQREFPPRDHITITDETGFEDRPYVRPTVGELLGDGYIRINLGRHYANPLSPGSIETFVHELTHAWQIEHYTLAWYLSQAVTNQVLPGDSYTYICDPDKKLSDYNAEQQAEIVKDAFKHNPCAMSITRSLRSDTWKLLIGSDAVDMAVDPDGTYYMVNTKGKIYRYAGDDWQELAGGDGKAIAANGGRVCLVNTARNIYELSGDAWRQMPGSDAQDVAIDSSGAAWIVNTAGKIYRFNGSSWTTMPGSDGARISAGDGQVWLVNTAGKIYRFSGSKWEQTSGSSGRDVTVSNDGQIFLTNVVGNIYRWAGASWTELDGSDGVALDANANKLVLVNTKGRMYFSTY